MPRKGSHIVAPVLRIELKRWSLFRYLHRGNIHVGPLSPALRQPQTSPSGLGHKAVHPASRYQNIRGRQLTVTGLIEAES